MHEFSLIENILRTVEETAQREHLRTVTSVKLVVGRMRQIVPETMRFAFEAASKGTVAEGAALHMEFVPIRMRCGACGHEFEVDDRVFVCPQCGDTDLELKKGMELLIESMEGEDSWRSRS